MDELMLSGYCFQCDQARIVEAEVEDGRLIEADCNFDVCLHRGKCAIGRRLLSLSGLESGD